MANKVTIAKFGLQNGTDRTIFVSWSWDKKNTKEYKVVWKYATGDGVAFLGSESSVTVKNATYDAPENATAVTVQVKPIGNDGCGWTGDWSEKKKYTFSKQAPTTPSTPTVTIRNNDDGTGCLLEMSLNNYTTANPDETVIQFQVVKNDDTVFKTVNSEITTSSAYYSLSLSSYDYFKVRCRAVYVGSSTHLYSEWSEYTDSVQSAPISAGNGLTVRAESETSVYLEWGTAEGATGYEVQYTTEVNYFYDNSNSIESVTFDDQQVGAFYVTGLESGNKYYFRVRATNDTGYSDWSNIVEITLGEKPSAPTTWSSTTTAVIGDTLNLYWVHNATDNSSQVKAELEIIIKTGLVTVSTNTYTITNDRDEDHKDDTSVYSIDTSSYTKGTTIDWRVRTAGVTEEYGDWSIMRTIEVYVKPSATLLVTDSHGSTISTLTIFPLFLYMPISSDATTNQSVVSVYIEIKATDDYMTVDTTGEDKQVKSGDVVFSATYTGRYASAFTYPAGNYGLSLTPYDGVDISLADNQEYEVTATASLSSGITVSDSAVFTTSFTESDLYIDGSVTINKDDISAYVRVECCYEKSTKYICKKSGSSYIQTSTVLDDSIIGKPVADTFTRTDNLQIYEYTDSSGNTGYYCKIESPGPVAGSVRIAVYRREVDGKLTKIESGLTNRQGLVVVDPHPPLNYAKYRIVAINLGTSAVIYEDLAAVSTGELSVVIQWDEKWSNFVIGTEYNDEVAEHPWAGSLLKLPYNIDMSFNHGPDVSLIEYIGREHPVSYYGTQKGETASWSVEIDKKDTDTIYALRRLAVWMGDAYVREPSGSGYWANVKVSFKRTYNNLVIPITLDITRVEGGA